MGYFYQQGSGITTREQLRRRLANDYIQQALDPAERAQDVDGLLRVGDALEVNFVDEPPPHVLDYFPCRNRRRRCVWFDWCANDDTANALPE